MATPVPSLEAGKIFEFLLGNNKAPSVVSPKDLTNRQHDPFVNIVLGQGHLPLTLRELLKIVDASTGPGSLPDQRSYLVADGGQIPWSVATENIDRAMRFIVTRGVRGQPPALLVSTSSDFDSTDTFLQVIGWDSSNGAFQFYERRNGSWVWAGNSWDALIAPTRGNGPFDSHVNGALNMKELKFPWINWHSQAATIDGAVAPTDPLRNEPLWQRRRGGEDFEMLVARPGIKQWTDARIAKHTLNGRLTRLPEFFRQVLDTSTINLRTSAIAMSNVAAGVSIPLPLTFFLNSDELIDELRLDSGLKTLPSVDGGIYLDILKQFGVALSDGTMRFEGDTHFVFLYPEAAFEDVLIVNKLRSLGILSGKLAASLLMVDFCNPVFSNRRKVLLAYVPADASVGAASDFATQFVAAIQAASESKEAGSPESEFLANWATTDATWKTVFSQRISTFLAAILPKLSNKTDFARVFELAESRRREFRKRPLFEFQLTTPVTNIPSNAPLLEFTPGGAIQEKKAHP